MAHRMPDRMSVGAMLMGDAPQGLDQLKVLDTLTFTTSQTYIIPAGVAVNILALGGGGLPGSNATSNPGDGSNPGGANGGDGGSGMLDTKFMPVDVGDELQLVIGAYGGQTIIKRNGLNVLIANPGTKGKNGYIAPASGVSPVYIGGDGGNGYVPGKGGDAWRPIGYYSVVIPGVNGSQISNWGMSWIGSYGSVGTERAPGSGKGGTPSESGYSGRAMIQLLGY